MGDPAKRRKRAKEKAAEARRRRGASPWAVLGKSGGECAVYVNGNWRETNLLSLWAFRAGFNGGWVAAAFLIDLDCLGLKDAFVTDDCSKSLVLERMSEQGGAEHITLEDARRRVAGAIRWTTEHDFRLPERYQKALALLGGIGDWHDADVSDFAPSGKMRYIGSMQSLEKRLIGRTADEFFKEDGVEYMMEVGAEQVGEITGMNPAELFDGEDEEAWADSPAADGLLDATLDQIHEWCLSRGIEPNPLLPVALPAILLAATGAEAEGGKSYRDAFKEAILGIVAELPPAAQGNMEAACIQIMEYLTATQTAKAGK